MNNLDYWQTFVGETAPEDFMRSYGTMDPELCVSRFLEDRGHLFGVVNQGSWRGTFQAPDQFHRLTVRIYLLSYLEETREDWGPALEAKPPSIPRRYREKFDQDKYPPPPADVLSQADSELPAEDTVTDDTAPGEEDYSEEVAFDTSGPSDGDLSDTEDESTGADDAELEASLTDDSVLTEETGDSAAP